MTKEDGFGLFNGIVPAGMERMTFQETRACPNESAQDAMPSDGLSGVLRARGLKPAGRREQRRDPSPIQTDHDETGLSHYRFDGGISPSRCKAETHTCRSSSW
jgi:hypothetical protein